MRKKLALLLAAIMVIGMIPMTAFATTTNRISKVITGEEDTVLTTTNAPELKIYEKDLQENTSAQAFQLDLANAEWQIKDLEAAMKADGYDDVKITKLTAKSIVMEVSAQRDAVDNKWGIVVPMLVELTDNGDATVTIDPMESVISAGTYKFATVSDADATVTLEGRRDVSENGRNLKVITIKETAAGALKDGDKLKLKLSSDWYFLTEHGNKGVDFTVYPKGSVSLRSVDSEGDEDWEAVLDVEATDIAKVITIVGWVAYDDDEVEPGDICEMTVSGTNVDKTTLEVARAVTYGVSWTAEDKDLPIFYSGSADEDVDSLEITMEEDVKSSWLADRKTKIVFPEGVKVLGVDISDKDGGIKEGTFKINEDANELTFTGWKTDPTDTAEVHFTFQLSIKPDFTGDITATLTGTGVDEEISAVIGKAVAPVTVEAESSDVVIDYRHTAIGDITITEAEAGLLEKGTTLGLKVENLSFDDDPTVEVVSGDMKIKDVDVDGGVIQIEIDSSSAKEPAVIKVTNCELIMDRSIPAGSYALKLTATNPVAKDDDDITWNGTNFNWNDEDSDDAIFKNAIKDGMNEDNTPLFDKRNVTVATNYVNVVTAGRDVDDSTFTTTLKVTIGATEMYANDKAIALDVPAYIANGYTMLPVRAVTEALSGTAIVRWDDATKTVTITFGARVINMTVGSSTMVINGVDVPMQAACEITDSRAFIPLRDMGYALGLNDSAINWDDATKTATLN